MNYYNDNDPNSVAWLRQLVLAGIIPQGDIDDRSIADVTGNDLKGYAQCHFFAGIAGWPEALRIAGYPVSTEIWTGSCPCQPFSVAGRHGKTDDKRHLWPELRRLIAECSPSVVIGEQVASNDGRNWLAGVRSDLEALGYAVGSADLCAAGVGTPGEIGVLRSGEIEWEHGVIGAPHIRQRLWWVADARRECHERQGESGIVSVQTTDTQKQDLDKTGRNDSIRERERGRDAASDRGAIGGMGETKSGGRQSERGGLPQNAGKSTGFYQDSNYQSSSPSAVINEWMGDANGAGPQGRRIDAGEYADQRAAGTTGELGGVAYSGSLGRKRDANVLRSDGENSTEWHQEVSHSERGCADFWSGFDLIPCLDNKARRVESGTFPLAYGVPARMGRLRGYGNAIVPQVAATFIRAWMEVSGRA